MYREMPADSRREPNPFDAIARFYDWEHAIFQDDVPMYLGFTRRTGGPVLELACGTGRLARPLAAAGIDVVGLDSSPDMLAIARRELEAAGLAERVTLVEADLRDFDLGQPYPFAFVALDSFGLLVQRDDQLAALRQIRRHLLPGGLLLLDLANGNLRGGEPRDELIVQHSGADPSSGRPLTKWTARRSDPAAQLDRLTYLYDEVQEDNSVKRWTTELRLRYFGRFELELLLERAGFVVEALYGSYDLDAFDAASERLIAVAFNPESLT